MIQTKRSNLPEYPDGIVRFVEVKKRPTSFGARQNPTTDDDLDLVVCCVFAYESIRERDVEFANQLGTTFSLKIRTPKAPGVRTRLKAQIGSMLYDVAHVDPSTYELYVYLEGGVEIAARPEPDDQPDELDPRQD